MGIIKKILETFTGKEKLSEPATVIGRIFEDEVTVEHSFFDAVLARFENFDQFNDEHRSKTFADDVDFIIRCVKESLATPEDVKRFPRRIDSYFYIYRRITEYFLIVKESTAWTFTLQTSVKQLRETILMQLASVFTETKGFQPNLCVKDKDLLKRIDIYDHLCSITRIDKYTINLFFALCKLSFQSILLMGDYHLQQWKIVLVKIKDFGINLQELIPCYVSFELGFRDFPLNIPAFIELIRRLHPVQGSEESPFFIFIRLCKNLNLSVEEFFEQFRPIFDKKMKESCYKESHVASLLLTIGRRDRIFDEYFSLYASHVNNDNLWMMFLYLSEKSELNENIQNQLTAKLSTRVPSSSIESFLLKTKLMEKSVEKMNPERRPCVLKMYIAIFNAFVEKQLGDERYSYLFYEKNLKEFLGIIIKVSSTPAEAMQQPSSLLIIQKLLFTNKDRYPNVGEQIKSLFRTLADFDQSFIANNEPANIIKNQWLQSYLLTVPQDFVSKINRDLYRQLCENHKNNRWTIYVWNRLLQLSFLKATHENTTETLSKLNTWMDLVKHDIYDANDILTISFVVNLFELMLFKQTKSILSLPKIEFIMRFVLALKEREIFDLNREHVNEFIQNAQKSIQNVLQLQSKILDHPEVPKGESLSFR